MCFMVRDCLIASDDAALIHYKRETTMFLKITPRLTVTVNLITSFTIPTATTTRTTWTRPKRAGSLVLRKMRKEKGRKDDLGLRMEEKGKGKEEEADERGRGGLGRGGGDPSKYMYLGRGVGGMQGTAAWGGTAHGR